MLVCLMLGLTADTFCIQMSCACKTKATSMYIYVGLCRQWILLIKYTLILTDTSTPFVKMYCLEKTYYFVLKPKGVLAKIKPFG